MKPLLIALLTVATAACGAYRFPGEAQSGTGIVSGQVTAVPSAPVQPATKPCAARPVPGIEIDFTGDHGMVSTRTDSSGNYAVELAAGTWKVSFAGNMRIISGPPSVTVTTGAKVVANYVLDSGIRYPVSKGPAVRGPG